MEITKGYKQTAVGVIPEDWDLIKLDQNFSLKARIGWQGLTTAEYLASGNFGLVTGTDFKDGYINWDSCVFVEKIRFDQDRNIQLKIGDVLITKDGTIGKVAFIDKLPQPTTLNSGVFVLRPKYEKINNRFFYYILMSFYFNEFLNKITAGSTITHLYQKDFIHFVSTLPPLPEQTAIAEALSDMDALIAQTEKLIEKKKAIKQGMMQELLTPKEGWVTKKLGELISNFQNGFGFSALGYVSIGTPIVTMAQIGLDGNFYFNESKVNKWETSDFNSLKSYHLNNGDLIIAMTDVTPEKNLIGRMAIVKTKQTLLLNQRVGLLRLDPQKINPFFLKTISNMSTWRSYCIGAASLGVQANIGTRDIMNGLIKVPDISIQNNIAQVLSDIDEQIQNIETKLQKLKLQKQGMMQALLTGKIRLV